MKLMFEPRDIWLGVYIGPRTYDYGDPIGYFAEWRDIYVCFIPTIVLVFRWWYVKA